MKKTLKMTAAAVSALCIAAGCVLPAAAGTLSAEELFRKYDHSAYLTDENGEPVMTYDCNEKENPQKTAEAMDYFEVRTCGYDTSYAETLDDLPVKEVELGVTDRYIDAEGNEKTIFTAAETITAVVFNAHRFREIETGTYCYSDVCFGNDGIMYTKEGDHACIVGLYEHMFNQSGTDTLIIPDKLGGLPVTEIADGAFWYPEFEAPASLHSIVLPDTVEIIGWHAFDGAILDCTDGASIHLPASVKAIYPYAFRNVGHYLDTKYYPESLEYLGRYAVSKPFYSYTLTFDENRNPIYTPNQRVPENATDAIYRRGTGCEMQLPDSPVFVEDASRTHIMFEYIFDDNGEPIAFSDKVDGMYFICDGALRLTDAAKYYLSGSAKEPKPAAGNDINGDGTTDVKDAVLLSRIVGGDTTVAAMNVNLAAADVNGNGKTDAADLTMLLRQLARLE